MYIFGALWYNWVMSHYICTGGCRGVGNEAGTCQATTCPLYGEELQGCDCQDGKHDGAFGDEAGGKDVSFEGDR